MPQDNITKIQRDDHDTLIRVESKVDQLVQDIKELKDGTNQRIASLEIKMEAMEKLRATYDPVKLVPMIMANDQWIHDFKLTYRVVIAVATVIGAIVGFLMALLTNATNLLNN